MSSPPSNSAASPSIAVIGPHEPQRTAIARALLHTGTPLALQEFYSYPFELQQSIRLIEHYFDAVLVDLDGDPEYALHVIGNLATRTTVTVMVYSACADREQVIHCMRAGAREFLSLPLAPGDMAGALGRIPARVPAGVPVPTPDTPAEPPPASLALATVAPVLLSATPRTARALHVFQGAKGGCGVTTIAAAFAVALAQDSDESTLLIDLGAPLGDAAIQLGLPHDYSTAHALYDTRRLDESFLRSLLVRHASGLSLLAAPADLPPDEAHAAGARIHAIDKLLTVARQSFHHVVVDIGSRIDLMDSTLFEEAANLYLVTEVGLSELRNAHRMLTQCFGARQRKPQIVLNRYAARTLGFDDDNVARALNRPVQWKIPDEDGGNSRTRHTIAELAPEDSSVFKAVRPMARDAAGLSALPVKKKAFSLFGSSRASRPRPAPSGRNQIELTLAQRRRA